MYALVDPQEELSSTLPFFTVAVTTYNRSDLLAKAIQSVFRQSFTDYEMVIVDDASPDDTEEVIKQFIEESDRGDGRGRISYVRQPTNRGIIAARNEALNCAQGKFVVFLDDDDSYTPDFLSVLHQGIQDAPPSLDFVLTSRSMVRAAADGDIVLHTSTFNHLQEATFLPGECYFGAIFGGGTGLTVRLSAARAVGGFSSDFVNGEDIDFLMRLATQGDFLVLPKATVLVYSTDRPQMTKNRMEGGIANERLADRHAAMLSVYPLEHRKLYISSARMYYSIKVRGKGRRCMGKALRITPFSYKTWRRFLLYEVAHYLPFSLRRRYFNLARHGDLGTK